MGFREDLCGMIKDVPDFPKPGVVFKDITPLLSGNGLYKLVAEIHGQLEVKGIEYDKIVAIESRGFIIGAALSSMVAKPLVLARKAGKLPGNVVGMDYQTEYSYDTIEIKMDDIKPGEKILIVDDLLATGGTVEAVSIIVEEELCAKVVACYVVTELKFLKGQDKLHFPVISMLEVEE